LSLGNSKWTTRAIVVPPREVFLRLCPHDRQQRFSGSMRAGHLRAALEPLRRIADDQAQDSAGQHDWQIVMLARGGWHRGDGKREHQSYCKPEQNSKRTRIYFSREVADQPPSNQPFDRGTDE